MRLFLQAADSYKSLLAKLETMHEFDLSAYVSPQRAQSMKRALKLALLMCQRILICLGDVARYKTQNSRPTSVDYGRARK